MIQNHPRELVSCQVSCMVRGTLTYSAATGLNGALVTEHYGTIYLFVCLMWKKNKRKLHETFKINMDVFRQ